MVDDSASVMPMIVFAFIFLYVFSSNYLALIVYVSNVS